MLMGNSMRNVKGLFPIWHFKPVLFHFARLKLNISLYVFMYACMYNLIHPGAGRSNTTVKLNSHTRIH